MCRYLNFTASLFLINLMFITACNAPEERGYAVVNLNTTILNTAKMTEVDSYLIDTSIMGPAVIAAFLHDTTEIAKNSTVPAVDVFVCKSFKRDTVLGDTIVIFDTQLRGQISGKINNYWTELRCTKKWGKCEVAVPANELSNIKRYKYKYARVMLVTDD